MSDESISQFDWRLVNQQRQIDDCVFRLLGLLYRTKHSLVCNLIVYYHYRTVHNKETVTGEEILNSHAACLLTYKFPSVTISAFRETLPPLFDRKYQ